MTGKFLKNILNAVKYDCSDQIDSVIKELNDLGSCCTLYYPSSGNDLSDILFGNGLIIPELDFKFPKVYIHSDAINYLESQFGSFYPLLNGPSFRCVVSLKIEVNGDKCIRIGKFNRNGLQSEFWLIEFYGMTNEDIIKQMISSNFSIDLLFNKCDTMFGGMGFISGSVPPLFYWFLFPELRIKYSISEYTIDRLKSEILIFNEKWRNEIIVNFPKIDTDNLNFDQIIESIIYQNDALIRRNDYSDLRMGLYTY